MSETEPRRRPSNPRRAIRRLAALALIAAVSVACSDDQGGEIIITPICLDIAPNGSSATPRVVPRLGADSGCNIIDVELVVTGPLDKAASASFTITYPNAFSIFEQAVVGPFLTDGGDTFRCDGSVTAGVSCMVDHDFTTGTVTVGFSRVDGIGVDLAAGESALLATIVMRQLTTATLDGPFTFLNPASPSDPADSVILDDGTQTGTNPAELTRNFVGGSLFIAEVP